MLIKNQHFYLQGCTAIKYKNEFYLMKLSATATLHHKSFCLDKIEKNLHQNHVFLRKGPRLYLKKIKSTKHQRREKMKLLNDPSLSQNGFVIFFQSRLFDGSTLVAECSTQPRVFRWKQLSNISACADVVEVRLRTELTYKQPHERGSLSCCVLNWYCFLNCRVVNHN